MDQDLRHDSVPLKSQISFLLGGASKSPTISLQYAVNGYQQVVSLQGHYYWKHESTLNKVSEDNVTAAGDQVK